MPNAVALTLCRTHPGSRFLTPAYRIHPQNPYTVPRPNPLTPRNHPALVSHYLGG